MFYMCYSSDTFFQTSVNGYYVKSAQGTHPVLKYFAVCKVNGCDGNEIKFSFYSQNTIANSKLSMLLVHICAKFVW